MNLAIGFFDGVHRGHQKILADADAVLTFSNHPLSVLDPSRMPALLMDADERIAMLAAAGADRPRDVKSLRFTREFAAMKPERFAAFLRREYPSLGRVYCGGNWRFGANGAGTPKMLRELGLDVEVVRYATYMKAPISSTRIRTALSEGDVKGANAMLGRPFAVTGQVVSGKGLGRRIGSPTLNVAVAPPLKLGVYAVDTPYGRGVANYGVAPTMCDMAWAAPVLEVHLFDGGALPDSGSPATLRATFLAFLRPEETFGSREALCEQIAADVAAAKNMV